MNTIIDKNKEPQHWKVLKSKVLIDDLPWLRLHEQELLMPHGGTIPRFWVFEYPDWASVLAVTKTGEILLIRQYRHAVGKVAWELPAGIIDKGETPLQAAQRELLEETGYGGGTWQEWTKANANPSTHTNTCYCYLALGVEKVQAQHLEKNEEITVYSLSVAEVRAILLAHGVEQSMHIAPLWRYLAEGLNAKQSTFLK